MLEAIDSAELVERIDYLQMEEDRTAALIERAVTNALVQVLVAMKKRDE